ncbi:MAG: class I SAM-dependent methyltransferase [Bacteroidales bacterium]|nr:class I SAM-dependent methyltransferase [Bacteroidales bacterium]MCR5363325.1 O-methyltransferase [Bacteroidales bacterium]
METPLEKYLREHSDAQSQALDWIVRQTHIRTNYPQMLSGSVQGALLTMLVKLVKPRRVLEIGCFTGYSTVCMAYGLPEGGHIDSLEINEELEYLILEGFEKAGVKDRITMHFGDAKKTLGTLQGPYDLVFMDADKRDYCAYYEQMKPLLHSGSLILADDVLWDGKVYADPVPGDAQTRGIVAFNDMIAADPTVEKVLLPLRDGLYLIRKV